MPDPDGSELHSTFNLNESTSDKEGIFIPLESVSYRSAEYVKEYSDKVGLSNGPGVELSPLSFQFQKTASNWQVAAVSNIVMSIEIAGKSGTYKEVSFSIEVGVPIRLADRNMIIPSMQQTKPLGQQIKLQP